MGGSGSGNYGGRPIVEQGLTLDINSLIRQGSFRKGCKCTGTLTWNDPYSDGAIATIGYEAFMGQEDGSVRLTYTTTDYWSGEKRQHDYRLQLTTTEQPFGGRRWWWICPKLGRVVSKLHKPNGGGVFASRKAHRLAYRSQRVTPYDRAINRAFKLRRRLGSEEGIGEYILKPKGMRWATFDRKMAQIEAVEQVVNARLGVFIARIGFPI
jgi:hypothetical protein